MTNKPKRGKINFNEEIVGYSGEGSGVEQELPEAEDLENTPFDPLKLSLITKPMTASDCLKRIEQGTLNLSPDFQRNEVWDHVRRSRLIESLMLKIPLPMFYVSSDEIENYQVVDGLQRLSTLRDFVLNNGKKFKLEGLEFWKNYNGATFSDLPVHLQNRITEASFTFTIINPGTPERMKRDVFKRINTGGLSLTDQEIRHALYSGVSTELLGSLVQTKEFLHATDYSIKDQRMAGRELILRYISFLIRDPKQYIGYTMDDWLSHTMEILNIFETEYPNEKLLKIVSDNLSDYNKLPKLRVDTVEDIRDYFRLSMIRARKLFGPYAFRKSVVAPRTPVNKGLFEVWSVTLSFLEEETFESLYSRRGKLKEKLIELYQDPSFDRLISRGSNKAKSVRDRYEKITTVINNLLED